MIRISEGSYLQSYLLMTLCIHVLCIISSLCISTPTELGIKAINYWFHRKRELISQRFTNDFIIESIKFLLKTTFYSMTTCTFIYLEQQWAQNVLPVCLFNCRLEETTFH